MVRLYAKIMQPSLLFPNNSQKTPKFIQKNLRKKSLLHKTLRFFEKKNYGKNSLQQKTFKLLGKKNPCCTKYSDFLGKIMGKKKKLNYNIKKTSLKRVEDQKSCSWPPLIKNHS